MKTRKEFLTAAYKFLAAKRNSVKCHGAELIEVEQCITTVESELRIENKEFVKTELQNVCV